MRVRDSLSEGVSHFYAELQRLKMVLDMARGERTVLFLLDEILHGTNTRERSSGRAPSCASGGPEGHGGSLDARSGIADLESELAGR